MKEQIVKSRGKLVAAALLAVTLAFSSPAFGLPAFSATANGGSCYQGDYGTGWDQWKFIRSYVVVGPPYNYSNDHDHYDWWGQRGPLHTDHTYCV